jgi:hypothetical protein
MVLGHFGVGLGAKKFAPSLSLGLLFMAAQWVDLLWPVLLLFDVEHVDVNKGNAHFPLEFTSYPITHSLLDLIVHKPDLPLFPGDSPRVGFGLWNFPVGTAIVEGSIFIIGLALYLRSTRAKDRQGKWGLWLLVFLLIANQIAGALSPLPPSAHAIGWAAQYQWIFNLLGFWVDRHRSPLDAALSGQALYR